MQLKPTYANHNIGTEFGVDFRPFLSDPGVPGVRSMGPLVRLTEAPLRRII